MLLKDFVDVIQSQSAQIILVALYLLKRFVNPSLIQLISLQDEEDSTSSKMPRYAVLGKRHECSLCGRKFNRIDALKRHVKQVHERRAAQREYDLTLSLDLQALRFSFACQKSYLRVDIFHKENFMEIQSFCFYRLVSYSKIHLQSAAFIYR